MDTREVSAIISRTAESVSALEPGTLVQHIVLSEMLGVGRREEREKYYNMIQKLKTELRVKHGVFLKTQHKLGYEYVKAGDEIDICDGGVAQGVKRIVRSVRQMQDIRMDKINNEEKKAKTLRIANERASLIGLLKLGNAQQQKAIAN